MRKIINNKINKAVLSAAINEKTNTIEFYEKKIYIFF